MNSLSWQEFERRCQKPDHRRVGNWMARRIARPVALRVTRVVAPWGISGNAVTLAAWGVGLSAAAALAWGTVWGWLLGAGLLQLWYLLDHVDGQVARLRGTASLDGVQLDYLMHHTLNVLIPVGVGWGLFVRHAEPLWALGGLAWGASLLLLTLQHDARYKAFFTRLKRLHGVLHVEGGGGGRPSPQPSIPRRPLRLLAWTLRKTCEAHVLMNVLGVLALGQVALGDESLFLGRLCLATLAPFALLVAAGTLIRSQHSQAAEQEFAAWFRVPPGSELLFLDGNWIVKTPENGGCREDRERRVPASPESS